MKNVIYETCKEHSNHIKSNINQLKNKIYGFFYFWRDVFGYEKTNART